jgi:hypothetical protein
MIFQVSSFRYPFSCRRSRNSVPPIKHLLAANPLSRMLLVGCPRVDSLSAEPPQEIYMIGGSQSLTRHNLHLSPNRVTVLWQWMEPCHELSVTEKWSDCQPGCVYAYIVICTVAAHVFFFLSSFNFARNISLWEGGVLEGSTIRLGSWR